MQAELKLPSGTEVDWDRVRLDVKVGELTRNRICARYGITPKRLADRIKENKWDVEEDATAHDRKIIIESLFLVAEKQVGHLLEGEMSGTGERESLLLGRLVTTLDRLISLDGRVTGRNRALWRQTLIPLVKRVADDLSFWLAPAFGGVQLRPDFDAVEALAEDRAALWERVGKAEFLSDEEKRRMLGVG